MDLDCDIAPEHVVVTRQLDGKSHAFSVLREFLDVGSGTNPEKQALTTDLVTRHFEVFLLAKFGRKIPVTFAYNAIQYFFYVADETIDELLVSRRGPASKAAVAVDSVEDASKRVYDGDDVAGNRFATFAFLFSKSESCDY